MLTDQQIADSFRKWHKRRHPRALPQHLESYLLQYLKQATWFTAMFPVEQVMLKNRVLRIVCREVGLSGAATRKKRKATERNVQLAAERKEQLALAQMKFDFDRETDHDS